MSTQKAPEVKVTSGEASSLQATADQAAAAQAAIDKTAKDQVAKDNLSSYFEYNKTLRAWLVGFGFGVPALFIINPGAQKIFLKATNAEWIVMLFLIGSGAQVAIAFLNKIIAWCTYRTSSAEDTAKISSPVKMFAALENVFLIDVLLDLVSLIAFGLSLHLMFRAFLAAAAQPEPAPILEVLLLMGFGSMKANPKDRGRALPLRREG